VASIGHIYWVRGDILLTSSPSLKFTIFLYLSISKLLLVRNWGVQTFPFRANKLLGITHEGAKTVRNTAPFVNCSLPRHRNVNITIWWTLKLSFDRL